MKEASYTQGRYFLILVGTDGSGKIRIGDTILGEQTPLKSEEVPNDGALLRYGEREGQEICVINTPGDLTSQHWKRISTLASSNDQNIVLVVMNPKKDKVQDVSRLLRSVATEEDFKKDTNACLLFTGVQSKKINTLEDVKKLADRFKLGVVTFKEGIQTDIANERVKDLFNRIMSIRNHTFNITIVGACRSGKSSTGNLLLGKKAFAPQLYPPEENQKKKELETKEKRDTDTNIKVFETPTSMICQRLGDIKETLKRETEASEVIMMTIKIKSKPEDEDLEILSRLKNGLIESKLGESFLKKHGVLVFTHEDEFSIIRDQGHVKSFDHFLQNEGQSFRTFIGLFGNRTVLTCNIYENEEEKENQKRKLLEIITGFKMDVE